MWVWRCECACRRDAHHGAQTTTINGSNWCCQCGREYQTVACGISLTLREKQSCMQKCVCVCLC
jgi:hypothetical protein